MASLKHLKQKGFTGFFVLVFFLLAFVLRSNTAVLPMNDEVIYTVASTNAFNSFLNGEINSEHPYFAKVLFSSVCLLKDCNVPAFEAFNFSWVLAKPLLPIAMPVIDLMLAMRLVSVFFGLALVFAFWFFLSKKSRETGLVAVGLAAISPLLIMYSGVVMLDMIMTLFFSATVLFYFFVYRKERSWKNAFVLAFLLFCALSSKQYIPFGLIPILLVADVFSTRKIDLKLVSAIGFATLAFFVFYPPSVFIQHLSFFQVGEHSHISLIQPLGILGMASYALLACLAYSLFKLVTKKDDDLRLAWLILSVGVVVSLANPGAFVPRYSLYLVPLMIFASALAFRNASNKVLTGFLALILFSLVVQMPFHPYYDEYRNAFSPVASENFSVERHNSLGVLSFIETQKYDSFLTNDFYGFPYYSGSVAIHYLNVLNTTHCFDVDKAQAQIDSINLPFVYRKDSWRHIEDCRFLPRVAEKGRILYDDDYYTVYAPSRNSTEQTH